MSIEENEIKENVQLIDIYKKQIKELKEELAKLEREDGKEIVDYEVKNNDVYGRHSTLDYSEEKANIKREIKYKEDAIKEMSKANIESKREVDRKAEETRHAEWAKNAQFHYTEHGEEKHTNNYLEYSVHNAYERYNNMGALRKSMAKLLKRKQKLDKIDQISYAGGLTQDEIYDYSTQVNRMFK